MQVCIFYMGKTIELSYEVVTSVGLVSFFFGYHSGIYDEDFTFYDTT